jgi:hypothetical protein
MSLSSIRDPAVQTENGDREVVNDKDGRDDSERKQSIVYLYI